MIIVNRDTCVIIPVFNEADVIEEVLNGVKKEFSQIVCVDDGSTDDSARLIRESGVEVVRHAKNKGSGAALRTGIQQALKRPHTKYFITFDADGQHRVPDAVALLNYLRNNPLDIVLGSRFMGRTVDMPAVKRVVLKAAIWFSNITTGLKMTDTHNGLRVFNRRVAEKMRLRCSGMAHASEIIYRIAENQFRYAERPVTIIYTAYSKAKGQSVFNSFNILRELMVYRMQREN
jgi:polyprenyl-phospho-N-acetylgalactosaminyl synthase